MRGGSGRHLEALLAVMARLRDPHAGCPWDRAQSFLSLVPHTLEEAYEVADAIEREAWNELPGELGDLLFQIVFYARIGEELGRFDFTDVVVAIHDKLVRRHPHVFGDARYPDATARAGAWERLKHEERGATGASSWLDGVAAALPALSRAAKLQRRAARAGFDWADAGPVFDKVAEELVETRAAHGATADRAVLQAEVGDLLFACVNLARHLDVDAEAALRGACAKFERRFQFIEQRLRAEGRDLDDADLAEMDRLWDEAKSLGY
jgi:MazG family protein